MFMLFIVLQSPVGFTELFVAFKGRANYYFVSRTSVNFFLLVLPHSFSAKEMDPMGIGEWLNHLLVCFIDMCMLFSCICVSLSRINNYSRVQFKYVLHCVDLLFFYVCGFLVCLCFL